MNRCLKIPVEIALVNPEVKELPVLVGSKLFQSLVGVLESL